MPSQSAAVASPSVWNTPSLTSYLQHSLAVCCLLVTVNRLTQLSIEAVEQNGWLLPSSPNSSCGWVGSLLRTRCAHREKALVFPSKDLA